MESPLYLIFLWFFFLCWNSVFFAELTYYVDQIYVFGFHLMNEFECEIQKVPLSKWIEAKHDEQYISRRKEIESRKKKINKRTQFANKFYSDSNKWAADKSIGAEYCILCWKPEVRLHFAYHSLHIVHTVCTRNDQDSWCTWSIWILDSFGFLFYCKPKIKWNAWNRFWMPFCIYSGCPIEVQMKYNVQEEQQIDGSMDGEKASHLILFLI